MYSIFDYRAPRNLWNNYFHIRDRSKRVGLLDTLSGGDFFGWLESESINHKVEESEDSKIMNIKINVPGYTTDDLNVTWDKSNSILEVTHKDKESMFHYASTISDKFIPTGSCGVEHGVLTVEFKRVEREEEENLIQLL